MCEICENRKDLELYIHIPFCIKKCNYCDFLSFPSSAEDREEYVRCLVKEIEQTGIVLNNKDTILNCSNIDCTGILKSKLKFAVSKKCLNLLNIGDEFINKVVDSGYVKDVVDFYKLDSYTILKILRPQLGK